MPIKKLTLGICLALVGQALAGSTTYRVREGDTLSSISERFHVSQRALVQMNGIEDRHALSIGQKITIPSSGKTAAKASSKKSVGGYVVVSGENDWTIAHKFGIKTPQLHALNPGVDWPSLQPGDHLVIPGQHSKPAQPAKVAKVTKIKTKLARVAKNDVIVREGPSRDDDAIVKVPQDTSAVVIARQGDWYKLRFTHGTVGWVRGDLLAPKQAPVTVQRFRRQRVRYAPVPAGGSFRLSAKPGTTDDQIIAKAESMKGTPYVWGGNTKNGTDCSGFTTQVFSSRGMRLPRTSREQAKVGQPVPGSDLKPGDLVFFKTTSKNQISHVGIYVGKGEFIHASSAGGHVQHNSLKEGYYKERFAAARRVVPTKKAAKAEKPKKEEPAKVEPPKEEPTKPVEPVEEPVIPPPTQEDPPK